MRTEPEEAEFSYADLLLAEKDPSPQWQQMGAQVGLWPFHWQLTAERVLHPPWRVYSIGIGPLEFTINLGRWL